MFAARGIFVGAYIERRS